jgi:hypothetical protein
LLFTDTKTKYIHRLFVLRFFVFRRRLFRRPPLLRGVVDACMACCDDKEIGDSGAWGKIFSIHLCTFKPPILYIANQQSWFAEYNKGGLSVAK